MWIYNCCTYNFDSAIVVFLNAIKCYSWFRWCDHVTCIKARAAFHSIKFFCLHFYTLWYVEQHYSQFSKKRLTTSGALWPNFQKFLTNYNFCSGYFDLSCNFQTFLGLNGWKLNKFWTLTIIEQLIYIFLRYQVNLNRPCPFWPDDGACALRDCSVAPCKEVCDHVTFSQYHVICSYWAE